MGPTGGIASRYFRLWHQVQSTVRTWPNPAPCDHELVLVVCEEAGPKQGMHVAKATQLPTTNIQRRPCRTNIATTAWHTMRGWAVFQASLRLLAPMLPTNAQCWHHASTHDEPQLPVACVTHSALLVQSAQLPASPAAPANTPNSSGEGCASMVTISAAQQWAVTQQRLPALRICSTVNNGLEDRLQASP